MENEKDLVTWAMLSLLIINMALAVFSYFVSQGLPINNPSITQLQGIEGSINTVGTNLANSFCSTNSTINKCPDWSIANFAAPALNFIYGVLFFIVNFIAFIITDLGAVLMISFIIIPGMLNVGLGNLGYVFSMIYTTGLVILGIYVFYIVRKMIR